MDNFNIEPIADVLVEDNLGEKGLMKKQTSTMMCTEMQIGTGLQKLYLMALSYGKV